MEIGKSKIADFYIGESVARDMQKIYGQRISPESACEDALSLINREQMDYLNDFSKYSGKNKLAVLNAHGGSCDGKWTFEDEPGSKRTVQNWVNSKSKDYHGILFLVCNPGEHEINSKKSVLIYPLSNLKVNDFGGLNPFISGGSLSANPFQFYSPAAEQGIIDSYTIEYESRKLKEKVSGKNLESFVR